MPGALSFGRYRAENHGMRVETSFGVTLLCAAILAACTQSSESPANVALLISGGLVFDGSGGEPFHADVGIANGRIVFIGDAAAAGMTARETIDAEGKWITPGFIDMHSHAELDLDYGRDAKPYLHQGIATVVLGVDGDGEPGVAGQMTSWEANGIGTNALTYIGHGAIRSAVMGNDDRSPTPAEIDEMRSLVRQGMEDGAFWLSTGLFYVPGNYASTEEVIELARVAAEYTGAIYDTHDRDLGAAYEGVGYDASVLEGIRIGEESGTRVIFSHFNLQGAHNRGRADVGARYINDARERGVDIWAAQHPYTATQSSLRAYTIPNWAAAGGHEAMVARFDDPEANERISRSTYEMLEIRGGADKILLVDERPDLNGKNLAQYARENELAIHEAVQAILREGNAKVMNLDLYDHDNTRRLATEPWMMTCTDGRTPRPDQPIAHPRTYGAFPMKFRTFVLEEKVLTPQAAIRSFTGLAADFLRLPDRGYLREGYVADIVVIDPTSYADRASYDSPQLLAEGVEELLVNGTFAIRDSVSTGALAGRAIRRPLPVTE
jgi:N-acyl-D-amino-acid deacylase